ncbi:iron chelate uptake ABC transporter family permease subunit [Nodosilinea sp. LEGE 07088]|uniref:FecCD family ABC transporter permease n=1 Tax=Nodosilinea sp. LEGE 07088 TaxID=2777968 RepID=UPI00187E4D27|nr:iron ABC transporter permease [Nodosilinea sp. LEGE 07088]MBE9135606.1 iron chelate uptake ABC transporter family permease subunit [Nodosilinea sp. LEGE 07088]
MVTLRKPPVQIVQPARSPYRTSLALGLLLLGLALVVSLSLTQGSVAMTGPELWAALLRQGSATHQVILWALRLPRLVAAMLVGASLGVSGALLQGILRNGLASPFLLGISSGAGLVVVLMVTLGLWQVWVPLGAWLGAIATTALVYLLAYSRGGLSVERLILGGVAFSSFFGAIQSLMLLMARDGRIQAALNWLIGSFNGRGWAEVRLVGPAMVVALVAGCLLARQVNLLNLGDELAVGCFESSELAHLDYALVSTTYAAQGKSAERVIGALDRHVARESFYVAVSRVKRELRLYASEDLERLIERVERSQAKENPGNVVGIGSGRPQPPDLPLPTNLDDLVAMASQQANLTHTNHGNSSDRRGRGFER